MAHRKFPSAERARRHLERRHGQVELWAVARPRPAQPAEGVPPAPLWVGEYRLSKRDYARGRRSSR